MKRLLCILMPCMSLYTYGAEDAHSSKKRTGAEIPSFTPLPPSPSAQALPAPLSSVPSLPAPSPNAHFLELLLVQQKNITDLVANQNLLFSQIQELAGSVLTHKITIDCLTNSLLKQQKEIGELRKEINTLKGKKIETEADALLKLDD